MLKIADVAFDSIDKEGFLPRVGALNIPAMAPASIGSPSGVPVL